MRSPFARVRAGVVVLLAAGHAVLPRGLLQGQGSVAAGQGHHEGVLGHRLDLLVAPLPPQVLLGVVESLHRLGGVGRRQRGVG